LNECIHTEGCTVPIGHFEKKCNVGSVWSGHITVNESWMGTIEEMYTHTTKTKKNAQGQAMQLMFG
jgi:hypothetical protein